MAKILIIDDDQSTVYMLSRIIEDAGHIPTAAFTLADGIARISKNDFDCVFLDVNLPDGNGISAIPTIRSLGSSPEIVIVTGKGDPDGAELAISNGAWSYIEKTNTVDQILLTLEQAIKYRERQNTVEHIALQRNDVIGSSRAMMNVLNKVAQVASIKSSVLLLGETGTGKEVLARTIHDNSPRASEEFVAVDCAAIPASLVESVLFGHMKGSFTGADASRQGLVKMAHNGTLFLDEIGELPLLMQSTLLRVTQEQTFRPVGGTHEEKSNFRLIAATNQNLAEMCLEGTFRRDLFYRIRTFTIEIPPLRDRRDDIRPLCLHYMAKICQDFELPVKGISDDAMDVFIKYDWPGNVRELVSTIERTIVAAGNSPMIYLEHTPIEIRAKIARHSLHRERPTGTIIENTSSNTLMTFKEHRNLALQSIEKEYLCKVLEKTRGNIKKACEITDLSRTRLYHLLKEHEISKNTFKKK